METVESFTPAKITTALAQENVTEGVIKKLQLHKSLVINDLDDKDGYNKVVEARKECKNTRILAEKICKKGREAAITEQKAWVAKEKEVVKQISEVETYLEGKEKWFELETEKVAIRLKRIERLPIRIAELGKVEGIVIPTDEVFLGMDDVAFITYLQNERTRILNEREAALQAKQRALLHDEQGHLPSTVGESLGVKGDIVWKGSQAVFTPNPQGKFTAGVDPSNPDSGDAMKVIYYGKGEVRQATDKDIISHIAENFFNMQFPIVQGEEAKKLISEVKADLKAIVDKIMNNLETIKS